VGPASARVGRRFPVEITRFEEPEQISHEVAERRAAHRGRCGADLRVQRVERLVEDRPGTEGGDLARLDEATFGAGVAIFTNDRERCGEARGLPVHQLERRLHNNCAPSRCPSYLLSVIRPTRPAKEPRMQAFRSVRRISTAGISPNCSGLAQLPQLRGCRSILSSTYERKLALHPDAKWDPEAFG
jgi:hypothetical protein